VTLFNYYCITGIGGDDVVIVTVFTLLMFLRWWLIVVVTFYYTNLHGCQCISACRQVSGMVGHFIGSCRLSSLLEGGGGRCLPASACPHLHVTLLLPTGRRGRGALCSLPSGSSVGYPDPTPVCPRGCSCSGRVFSSSRGASAFFSVAMLYCSAIR